MGDHKTYRSHKKVQGGGTAHSTKHKHGGAGKAATPAPKFDFSKVTAFDPNAVLDAPHADPDPRDDPKYIDNLSDFEVRQALLWADRYMVYYDGGEVTFWNADIDFTKQEKLLEVTDVASSQAEALIQSAHPSLRRRPRPTPTLCTRRYRKRPRGLASSTAKTQLRVLPRKARRGLRS